VPNELLPEPVERPKEMALFHLRPRFSSKLLLFILLSILVYYLLCYARVFSFPFIDIPEAALIGFAVLGGVVAWSHYQFLVHEKKAIETYVDINFPAGVNAFQMAHYLHGVDRAVQTAIVDLVNNGSLKIKNGETVVVTKQGQRSSGENPLYALLAKKNEGAKIDLEDITGNWGYEAGFFHPQLEKMQKRLHVFMFEEILPHLFILVVILHIMQTGTAGPYMMWVAVFLPSVSCRLFFRRRDILGRKKAFLENVKRKYIAETDVFSSEGIDPVKRFAIQKKPSVIAFPQPGLLNSILKEVAKSAAIRNDTTGSGGYVEDFKGARGNFRNGNVDITADEK
jgi:hypothetical protein